MRELQERFTGRGEVKGFEFYQVDANQYGYIYRVTTDGQTHYEVFKRKTGFTYDYQNKCKTDKQYVKYPNSNAFGVWAWTFKHYSDALEAYDLLEKIDRKNSKRVTV